MRRNDSRYIPNGFDLWEYRGNGFLCQHEMAAIWKDAHCEQSMRLRYGGTFYDDNKLRSLILKILL